jgi:hypothetical protein
MQTFLLIKSQGKRTVAKTAAIILVLSLLLMGSAAPTHAAAASTFNLVQEVPVVYAEYEPCAAGGVGEVLDFSGILKEVIHGTLTGDGHAIFSAKMVPNLVGVGRTTGDEYRMVGETGTTQIYTIDTNDPNQKWIVTEHFSLVTPGEGIIAVNMIVSHEIGNANGGLVSTVDRMSVECR